MRIAALVSGVVTLSLVTPTAAYASVSTTQEPSPRINGTVYAIAQVGDRTIIGGDFTLVGGQPRQHVAAIRADGTLDPTFTPDTDGTVYAVDGTADGSRIFIGGRFTQAGGLARANLAAVDGVTGEAVAGWQADTVGTYPDVLDVEVNGSRVYAAGRFGKVDGVFRSKLAALDVSAGDVIKSFKPTPNSASVRVVESRPDGSSVFVAGGFDVIGGQSRPAGVAELRSSDGSATAFAPRGVGSKVTAMDVTSNSERLYFGVQDNRVFAYEVPTSRLLWTVKNSGDTQAIAATEDEVFLGGHFSQSVTYRTKRVWAMSLTPEGALTTWDPKLGGGSMGVWAMEPTARALYVGGEFTAVGGSFSRPRFAEFSGVLTP